MKPFLCTIAATLLLATSRAPAVEPAEVETFLDRHVPAKLDEYRIPGAVVVVVGGEWPAPVLKGFGLADLERGVPMDAETSVLRVGSISKAVTATLALIAAERGELDLRDNLMPELSGFPIRPFADDTLTAHQLLTFTGGFNERLFGQHFRTPDALPDIASFLRDNLPPRFERSGRVSSYNDYQTTLLGHVIADRGDTSFADYGERRLFRPLGMNRSTFRQTDLPPALVKDLARAYRLWDGNFHPYPRDYVATTPAAGLYTTGVDMAQYLSAILGRHPAGTSVLRPDSWQAHISRQFAHLPELYAWGYGFAQDRRQGFEVWFKDGQASGFHARAIIVPELGLAIFSAINRNIIGPAGNFHPAVKFNRELGDELLKTLYADLVKPLKVPPPDDRVSDPRPYVGTYRNTVQSRHTPERILTLFDDITVAADGDELVLWGGVWREVRPGLLRWHEGGPNHVGFGDKVDGRYRYLFAGRGSYERVPWYGASHNTRWIAAVCAGLPILGIVAGLIALWRGRRRSRSVPGLLLVHGLVMTAFFVAFGLFFFKTDLQQLFFGIPWTLNLVLTLPVMAGVVLLALALALRSTTSPVGRGALALYILASAAGLLWLDYWRLLGPSL